MQINGKEWQFTPIAAYIWQGTISTPALPDLARDIKEAGGRLVALWGSDDRHLGAGFAIHSAFITTSGLIWVRTDLDAATPTYPDLSAIFPQANRMQRATYDLLGIRADGAIDTRKWLRHNAWADEVFPLRKDITGPIKDGEAVDNYPFIQVEGEGVHEIPVGPIHAGTIEPGHFRFSIVGEQILKLEERLGYTHQGVEKRFEGLDLATGAKLAGRVSGDTHSAYTWAYCMAVEQALGAKVPDRALWLRALFLESERVANHLGDLGSLGNDVALAFAFMQFWRLKEDWLRLCHNLFGHRYLFDRILPGGVAADLTPEGARRLIDLTHRLDTEVQQLKAIYDEHATLQDRFANTGVVKPALAAQLGLTGLAGRASNQAWDARVQFPQVPYDRLQVNMATSKQGDVLARIEVRYAEIQQSLHLIRQLVETMPSGALSSPLPAPLGVCQGLGWVEGWRGEVLVAVRIGADGRLDRVHPHDPSWLNWPLLEIGVLGNIVADFPLINKSFNLSYSGQDL